MIFYLLYLVCTLNCPISCYFHCQFLPRAAFTVAESSQMAAFLFVKLLEKNCIFSSPRVQKTKCEDLSYLVLRNVCNLKYITRMCCFFVIKKNILSGSACYSQAGKKERKKQTDYLFPKV